MQTILGSTGIIGTELAKALTQHTDKIRLVSRNPKRVNPTDQLVIADLTNFNEVLTAVEGSEVVYLTAGLQYKINVWQTKWPLIMKNVIEACKTHKTKLVFFDNVYAYGLVKGWYGSEVTRKFLKRKFEDPGYENIRGTETCALHAADFMYKIYSNKLVNNWVSLQMKTLLGRQLDKSKLSTGLPNTAMFYHKTGWFAYWTNDVGIIDDGEVKYIIACFIPLKEELALPKFKVLSEKVYALMKNRN